jgi:hypothetical protein
MTKYRVHFSEQDIVVDAEDSAEADFLAREGVECDSIEETDEECEF